jgi:hypothetical protein
MSAISVRLPEFYHRRLRELAKKEGVSMNQFIAMAIGEKISALDTESYLSERGNRGDLQKYLKALNKVANVPPKVDEDKID